MQIETRIQIIRSKAIIFRFDFFPEHGDELLAEGLSNLLAIDPTWRVRDLPAWVKRALS